MEKEEEVDRRRGGKTILESGQGWTLPAQLGQMKTGPDGKGLLRSHLSGTAGIQCTCRLSLLQ